VPLALFWIILSVWLAARKEVAERRKGSDVEMVLS
jgi:hypothetical protein